MRLSTISRRYTIVSLLIVFCIGGAIQFLIFRRSTYYSADESLRYYQKTILSYIQTHDTFMKATDMGLKPGQVLYIPMSTAHDRRYFFKDLVLYHSRSYFENDYRVINFPVEINGTPFRVEVWFPIMGRADMLQMTILSSVCMFVLLILLLLLLFQFFSRKIWGPFYSFVNELRDADLRQPSCLSLSNTGIDELQELDDTYKRMMERISRDYHRMQELSENITHELQTPLTIMRSKCDILLQKYEKDEEAVSLLHSLQANIGRLSRFNRSLMLLARIDNDDYENTGNVDMAALVKSKLEDYAELLEAHDIRTTVEEKGVFSPSINDSLAELLINNILSNAIKYNFPENGRIRVEVTSATLSIANTFADELPEGDLFDRFRKNKRHADSNGLGLSIVKAICQRSGLKASIRTKKQCFKIIISE